MWTGVQRAKAHKGGKLIMVIPKDIGKVGFTNTISKQELNEALEFLQALKGKQGLDTSPDSAMLGDSKESRGGIDKTGHNGQSSSPVSPPKEEVGGIDLNEINVERQGSGVNIQFDPAAIQPILDSGVDGLVPSEVEGFAPVIINITPI